LKYFNATSLDWKPTCAKSYWETKVKVC